jgi:hypothetical protein
MSRDRCAGYSAAHLIWGGPHTGAPAEQPDQQRQPEFSTTQPDQTAEHPDEHPPLRPTPPVLDRLNGSGLRGVTHPSIIPFEMGCARVAAEPRRSATRSLP